MKAQTVTHSELTKTEGNSQTIKQKEGQVNMDQVNLIRVGQRITVLGTQTGSAM